METMQAEYRKQNYVVSNAVSCDRTDGEIPAGIFTKGTVLAPYTQADIRKAMNHINSAPREELGGETPYKLALKKYGPEILEALQLKYVAPDDVILSPKLLKYDH